MRSPLARSVSPARRSRGRATAFQGIAAAAFAAALLLACRAGETQAPAAEAPRAVAVVNGEPIAAASLERELSRARGDAQGADDVLRRRLLDDAVDRALLLQEARARALAVSDAEVDRAVDALRAEYPGSHFDDLLAAERLSAAELRQRLRDELTVEKLFATAVFPDVQVPEPELLGYYREHAAEFDQPDEVHALQVVVATKEEARKLREELRRRPRSFEDVARRASIAPEGRRGGDLGWFGKGSGMPEVFDACFTLPVNTISEVTPSPYGFHLFKVVARRAGARRGFAEVRAGLAERLLREKRGRAKTEHLAALRARARIDVDENALAASH
jgi:peptidyl-prolyl cis-trans isomerase C